MHEQLRACFCSFLLRGQVARLSEQLEHSEAPAMSSRAGSSRCLCLQRTLLHPNSWTLNMAVTPVRPFPALKLRVKNATQPGGPVHGASHCDQAPESTGLRFGLRFKVQSLGRAEGPTTTSREGEPFADKTRIGGAGMAMAKPCKATMSWVHPTTCLWKTFDQPG